MLLLVVLFAIPNEYPKGRPVKIKGFVNFIFQITLVRKMHQRAVIDEDHKSWWLDSRLGAVVNFQTAAIL